MSLTGIPGTAIMACYENQVDFYIICGTDCGNRV